jgi:hypothetical protein
MSSNPTSQVEVTNISRLGGKVIERVFQDSGGGRTTYYVYFEDGTLLGWSYAIGQTFIRRPEREIPRSRSMGSWRYSFSLIYQRHPIL